MRSRNITPKPYEFDAARIKICEFVYNKYRNEVYFLQACAEDYDINEIKTAKLFLDLERYQELLASCK